jgi:dsRNA-specific ribonuclease
LGSAFGALSDLPILENPKGELQEFLQARCSEAPKYHVVSSSGPDHDRLFECTVHHAGVELARGSGKSKKAAESEAALAALKKLREQPAVAPERHVSTNEHCGSPGVDQHDAKLQGF